MKSSGKAIRRRGVISKELVFWGVVGVCVVGLMILSRRMEHDRRPQGSEGAGHPSVGRSLAQVSLTSLTGGGGDVTAEDLTGRITMINFWGTWCPPCRAEFPHIVEIDRKLRDNESFQLVSVSVPGGETNIEELRTNTERFVSSQKADISTYYDPNQTTWRAVVTALDGKNGVPTTLILGRDGTIRGVWTGYARGVERDMQQLLTELLDES